MAERREWTVTGMDCAACTTKVTRAVERLPGVSGVRVALMAERLTLDLAAGADATAIEGTVRKLGFGIAPKGQEAPRKKAFVLPTDSPAPDATDHAGTQRRTDAGAPHPHDGPAGPGMHWHRTSKGRLVILTGALLGGAWGIELLTSAELGYWAFLLACLMGVAPVAARAFAALRMGQPFTIEALMTIAAVGALISGAVEEAARAQGREGQPAAGPLARGDAGDEAHAGDQLVLGRPGAGDRLQELRQPRHRRRDSARASRAEHQGRSRPLAARTRAGAREAHSHRARGQDDSR